jgi:CheY-like chemotaxis protein
MMPTMDGIEFLRNLKANPVGRDTPVIVATNVSDQGVSDQAISNGAAMCIVKSEAEPQDLIDAVNSILD